MAAWVPNRKRIGSYIASYRREKESRCKEVEHNNYHNTSCKKDCLNHLNGAITAEICTIHALEQVLRQPLSHAWNAQVILQARLFRETVCDDDLI